MRRRTADGLFSRRPPSRPASPDSPGPPTWSGAPPGATARRGRRTPARRVPRRGRPGPAPPLDRPAWQAKVERHPRACVRGMPRPATGCTAASTASRGQELRDAIEQGTATGVEHDGRLCRSSAGHRGPATAPGPGRDDGPRPGRPASRKGVGDERGRPRAGGPGVHPVAYRKVTGGVRLAWGPDLDALVEAVVGTAARRGIDAYHAVQTVLSGRTILASGGAAAEPWPLSSEHLRGHLSIGSEFNELSPGSVVKHFAAESRTCGIGRIAFDSPIVIR
jgi:hypothetical protein